MDNQVVGSKAGWRIFPAIVGFASFLLVHTYLRLTWDEKWEPWFLNSTRGMALTEAMIFLTAFVTSLFQDFPAWRAMVAFVIASIIGMIVYLFSIGGPGNLGPIVVVVGGMAIVPPVVLGILLGQYVRLRMKKPT